MLLLFSKVRLLSCLKMLLDKRTLSRGGYTIFSTTKMVLFMTEVNTWKLLTVFTNIFTSDVVWVPGPRLAKTCTMAMGMVLEHDTYGAK